MRSIAQWLAHRRPKNRRTKLPQIVRVSLMCCLFGGAVQTAVAGSPTGFEAHQKYVSALSASVDMDIDDSNAVLKYVLSQSEKEIHVQPTENYSYFKFTHDGLHWQGNMRLETESGLTDKLHFAYFVVPAPWHQEEMGQYKAFGKLDGLVVNRTGEHKYEVRLGALERTFVLNDISKSDIPAKLLGPDQAYLGLAHDESGLRFHLLFDKTVGDFSYILDEQAKVADKLVELPNSETGLLVGIRTGFVFKPENDLSRKRLVGVYSDNISNNNYYDGPFDQLPDGYRGKMTIKDAFAQIDPEFSKTIDDFGNFKNRDGARVVIAPYIRYSTSSEFDGLSNCTSFHATSVDYRSCMKAFLER